MNKESYRYFVIGCISLWCSFPKFKSLMIIPFSHKSRKSLGWKGLLETMGSDPCWKRIPFRGAPAHRLPSQEVLTAGPSQPCDSSSRGSSLGHGSELQATAKHCSVPLLFIFHGFPNTFCLQF